GQHSPTFTLLKFRTKAAAWCSQWLPAKRYLALEGARKYRRTVHWQQDARGLTWSNLCGQGPSRDIKIGLLPVRNRNRSRILWFASEAVTPVQGRLVRPEVLPRAFRTRPAAMRISFFLDVGR